tara:strand:+ start:449 stop:655 length:207 start_codon:yes stop_codon:yes gene_type:complete
MEIYKTDERFMQFCRFMYDENCQERWHHGQEPYENATQYIDKNLNWLQNKYREQAKTERSWSSSIYLK